MKNLEAMLNARVARGHELRDVHVRAVLWFVVIFIASAAVIHVVAGVLFKHLAREHANAFPAEMPAVQLDRVPEPRLQISPKEDLRRSNQSPVKQ